MQLRGLPYRATTQDVKDTAVCSVSSVFCWEILNRKTIWKSPRFHGKTMENPIFHGKIRNIDGFSGEDFPKTNPLRMSGA